MNSHEFWLDIATSTRAYQIRQYLAHRNYLPLKREHRKAALEYAARRRELLR